VIFNKTDKTMLTSTVCYANIMHRQAVGLPVGTITTAIEGYHMASIHKQSGRSYWFASYRDAAGKQHFVSTKIEHGPSGKDTKERAVKAATNRRLAMEMATRLEEAERGNATEAHWRKLLGDISERVNERRMEFKVVETFLDDWLGRAEKTKSGGTYERYNGIVKNFKKSLGSKVKAAMADVTVQDVQK